MRTIEMVQTFDGHVHTSYRTATEHLEKLLGDVMLPLAHKITAAEKYTRIIDVLNDSTEAMREIIRIKDDMKMERHEE